MEAMTTADDRNPQASETGQRVAEQTASQLSETRLHGGVPTSVFLGKPGTVRQIDGSLGKAESIGTLKTKV